VRRRLLQVGFAKRAPGEPLRQAYNCACSAIWSKQYRNELCATGW
jgi:hypothetical protein